MFNISSWLYISYPLPDKVSTYDDSSTRLYLTKASEPETEYLSLLTDPSIDRDIISSVKLPVGTIQSKRERTFPAIYDGSWSEYGK